MTVAELIEKLQELPGDATVLVERGVVVNHAREVSPEVVCFGDRYILM